MTCFAELSLLHNELDGLEGDASHLASATGICRAAPIQSPKGSNQNLQIAIVDLKGGSLLQELDRDQKTALPTTPNHRSLLSAKRARLDSHWGAGLKLGFRSQREPSLNQRSNLAEVCDKLFGIRHL
jgi:hypothetical protein